MTTPTEYEISVLHELAGEVKPRKHDGAVFMQAIKTLRDSGFLDIKGDITDAGRKLFEGETLR